MTKTPAPATPTCVWVRHDNSLCGQPTFSGGYCSKHSVLILHRLATPATRSTPGASTTEETP